MNYFKLILLLPFVLVMSQCKKVDIPDPSVNVLFGKWRQVCQSSWGGGCEPVSKEIWIEIKKNGRYKRHEKGTLPSSDNFEFKQDKNYLGEIIYVIELKNNAREYNWYMQNDTLVLYDWHVADGGSYKYVRKD